MSAVVLTKEGREVFGLGEVLASVAVDLEVAVE